MPTQNQVAEHDTVWTDRPPRGRPAPYKGRAVAVATDDDLILFSGIRVLAERPTGDGLILEDLRAPSGQG